jgi:hypothetical protein
VTAAGVHKFEAAGLGKAPFAFDHFEVMLYVIPGVLQKPGGTCDYCGTAIAGAYFIRSADGQVFKVGCECVKKAGDAGLAKAIAPIEAEKRRAAAERRAAKEKAELADLLARFRSDAEMTAALRALPHPLAWARRRGLTRYDFVDFMVRNAGARKALQTLRRLYATPLADQVAEEAQRAEEAFIARCESLEAARYEENYR